MPDDPKPKPIEQAVTRREPASVALLPVEEMNAALAEYDARRTNFRKWLLGHFEQGVYFEPRPAARALFEHLDAPIRRVGALNVPVAYCPDLEEAILPQTPDILKAIRETARY